MSRLFYHTMQDNAGNVLFEVSGTMRIAGSGTLATIYGDEGLTVILPNPMTNHPSFGSFKCFLGAGDYDFYMAKPGYTFETLTGVQGHGTMAQQDANAVAITGGNIQASNVAINLPTVAGYTLVSGPGKVSLGDNTVIGGPAASDLVRLELQFNKSTHYGLKLRQLVTDVAALYPVTFSNAAGTEIGSISSTAAAVAYNTTSDARLKHAIAPLTGTLDVVRGLNPVAFRWKSDDTPGVGFLAGEVQEVIPTGVITGEKDAVDDEGNIVPQMIDYSKLVPWLTAALQETLAQVQALTARVAALEGATP